MSVQEQLTHDYLDLPSEEIDRRIRAAKGALGDSLLILGHHYQQDDVIKFANLRGDSFKLARQASEHDEAEYIVFCGVHFMAESADIVSAPHQKVVLPDLSAGCSLADMAQIDDVEYCWERLTGRKAERGGAEDHAPAEPSASGKPGDSIIPITYVNSAASLKAFCGRNGGAVCTSSNAAAVLEWAFTKGNRVLFFPDQHLGRNTAYKMGISLDDMALWDPIDGPDGAGLEEIRSKRVILWNGYCSVHQRFTTDQVKAARESFPGIEILVHPECRFDVVQAADYCGSTEYIIKMVKESPSGTKWAIGTEINLVHRLAGEYPDRHIMSLDPVVCVCSTMYRIDPMHLLWALENLVEGRVVNQVKVPADVAEWAKVALDRMLRIT